MQLPTSSAFNQKGVQDILRRETKFITSVLKLLPLPIATSQQEDDLLDSGSTKSISVPNNVKKPRAKTLVELQSRLQEICLKKQLTYKEKLIKKTIKTKIKKKGKQDQRKTQIKQERSKATKEVKKEEQNTTTHNTDLSNNRMVFSKFDFSEIGKKKHKQNKSDPQKTLEDLKKQKQKIQELREDGEVDKAVTINNKIAWKNALAKAEGRKVKDDEALLAKSIKKREQKKNQSKKKWEAREEGVKKMKDDRQKKRQENIDKRKKTKKINKLKRATKRGRIIPGF